MEKKEKHARKNPARKGKTIQQKPKPEPEPDLGVSTQIGLSIFIIIVDLHGTASVASSIDFTRAVCAAGGEGARACWFACGRGADCGALSNKLVSVHSYWELVLYIPLKQHGQHRKLGPHLLAPSEDALGREDPRP
jgi:hypothetical protein